MLQNAIQEAWDIEQEKEAIRWYVAEEQEQEVYKDSHPTNQAKVDGRTSTKKNVTFLLLSFEQMWSVCTNANVQATEIRTCKLMQ